MNASSSTGLPKRQRARACNGQVVIIAAHSDPFPARSTASTVWFRSHSQTRSVACGLTVRIIKAPLACSQPRPVTAWALGRLFRFATPRHHVGGKVWPTNVSVRTTTPKKRTWVFKLSVRTLILLSFVWSENNNKTTTSACSAPFPAQSTASTVRFLWMFARQKGWDTHFGHYKGFRADSRRCPFVIVDDRRARQMGRFWSAAAPVRRLWHGVRCQNPSGHGALQLARCC